MLFPGRAAAGTFATSYPSIFQCNTESTPESIPCLIPIALDEDSCLEYARAVAQRLGYPQASVLHIKFVSALQGAKWKMTSSVKDSVILVTDTHEQILEKLTRYAPEEASQTVKDLQLRKLDVESSICFQYLRFFLEVRILWFTGLDSINLPQDDARLHEIEDAYLKGILPFKEITKRYESAPSVPIL